MKVVVTGSLGHVTKPLTQKLIQQGHLVTVISRNADKQKDIEALGAKAAIGSMDDAGFLTNTFTGANAVYCMLVPFGGNFFDPNQDVPGVIAKAIQIANAYVQAIVQSGVKRVVYLSSVAAHTDKGNGLIVMHYHAENILKQLPPDVAITFLRPVGFYDNLLNFIPGIKHNGVIASNYGGDDMNYVVSAIDIATTAVEELTATTVGQKTRYVASEYLTCNQIASILGAAIGVPDLKWITLTDEQQLNGLKAFGMNASFAESFVELNANIHNGKIYEDYNEHKPMLGKTKLAEFAKEFAAFYHQK